MLYGGPHLSYVVIFPLSRHVWQTAVLICQKCFILAKTHYKICIIYLITSRRCCFVQRVLFMFNSCINMKKRHFTLFIYESCNWCTDCISISDVHVVLSNPTRCVLLQATYVTLSNRRVILSTQYVNPFMKCVVMWNVRFVSSMHGAILSQMYFILSKPYVNLSKPYVILSDAYADLSKHGVVLSS